MSLARANQRRATRTQHDSSRLTCLCMHYFDCGQVREILGDFLALILTRAAFNCVNSRHGFLRAPLNQHSDAYTFAICAHLSSTFVSQLRIPNIGAYSAPICVRLPALHTATALISQLDTLTASIHTCFQSCRRAFKAPATRRSLLPPAI